MCQMGKGEGGVQWSSLVLVPVPATCVCVFPLNTPLFSLSFLHPSLLVISPVEACNKLPCQDISPMTDVQLSFKCSDSLF